MSKDVFAAKAPHFFKLILPGTLRDGNLRIPRNFVRKYGDLVSTVYLKLPSGVEWEVGLTKHDDDVWFQNGWQEFSEYCSLDFGHLLVFRYEGNSRFYVLVFDTTAVEIDYPFYGTQCEDDNISREFQVPRQEEISSDSSLEIIDDFQPCPKTRAKSPSPSCLRPHKRTKPNPSDKTDRTPNLQASSQHFRHQGIHSEVAKLEKSKANDFTKRCPKFEVTERLQKSSEEAGALRRASAFKSENPFFMAVMRPAYIINSSSCGLHIPIKFYKDYLNVKNDSIILLVYNGRTWSVKFTFREESRLREAKLTRGWKEFVLDNNLGVGDICVFEFINGIEMSFDVKIFRGAKNAKSYLSPAINEGGNGMSLTKRCPKSEVTERLQQSFEEAGALRRASAFKSENPFFMAVMWPSYINSKYGLHIPHKFVKDYLNVKDDNIILLVHNGKTWSVKFTSMVNKRQRDAKLTRGWNEFVVDNNLEVGDVCVFEFINGMEISFDVKIFRAAKDAKSCLSPEINEGAGGMCFTKRCPKSEVTERLQPSFEEAGALRRASAFKSENPFFMVVMQPSYIDSKHGLCIPRMFVKSYIKQSEKLTVQVEDKLWHMKMLYYPHLPAVALNAAGWSTFARENALQVGDVCVFELIKRDDVVLKVCIFRRCG